MNRPTLASKSAWQVLIGLTVVFAMSSCGPLQHQALRPSPTPDPPPLVSPIATNEETERGGQIEADRQEKEDGYREAAEFYKLKRIAAGEELPVERYIEGKKHAERMPRYSISRGRSVAATEKAAGQGTALGTWKPLGPGNVGGRTRALAIRPDDPNTMYAGATGGGIWKTTDRGESWKPLSDFLPSIGISTIAMDPKNPDTLYAGSGEWYTGSTRGDSIRGAGIYKTKDGGVTWDLLGGTKTTSFYYVNKIVVSPVDSNHIYAATYGGVWRSLDGGETWSRSLNRASQNLGCQDVVIRSDQKTDYVFVSCLSRGGPSSAIFRNTDAAGAGAWDSVLTATNMDRASLALAPSDQNVIYALASSQESGDNLYGLLAVYRSVNSGDPNTWEARTDSSTASRLNRVLLTNPRGAFADVCSDGVKTFSNQGEYDNALAVDPSNPDVVWAAGIDIFRSDDGGANWGIASFWEVTSQGNAHADVHLLAFAPNYDGSANQTLYAATDGGVFVTKNALASLSIGDRAACFPYPSAVKWTSLNSGYATSMFYHGTVYPGGASFVGGTQDNGTLIGLDSLGPSRWLTILGGDGGFFGIDSKDPNILYMETTGLSLRRSLDGGKTVSTATRGITESTSNFLFITPFILDPSESKRLYLGGRTLWRSNDGASNWSEASSGIPTSSGIISAIAVAPSDPNRMVFGTSSGRIYRQSSALSADKTSVWESSLPRTGYVSRLTFDPQNSDVVYATYSQFKSLAPDSHIYKSMDGGASWIDSDGKGDTALPDVPVFSLIVDPQNPLNLYVGSDIGVFASTDGGNSWARDDNPFANAVTEVLVLDRSGGESNLFAFSHGRGAWKTTLQGGAGACQYNLATDPIRVSSYGAPVSFDVDTAEGCAWSAITIGLPVVSPAGGTGKGKFSIPASTNLTTSPRITIATLQDKSVTITQDAAVRAAGNDASDSPFAMPSIPGVLIQDTSAATEQPEDPIHSCTSSADSKTVWFKVTASQTGTLQLSFRSARLDNGADSGAVMTVYDGGGTELGCSITSQATNVITTRFKNLQVNKGDVLSVEVSATLVNSPTGSKLMGGNLALTATMLN